MKRPWVYKATYPRLADRRYIASLIDSRFPIVV